MQHAYSSSSFTKPNYQLAPKQELALSTIMQHYRDLCLKQPLRMIIQGTTSTGKSYLIDCIRETLNNFNLDKKSPLLMLAPIGVVSYNIHASTIHAGLRIPIREMRPLQGQALTLFQEEMCNIEYILIDEMNFIGPKLFTKIDSHLLEAFPHKKHQCFGGVSIILIGDLAQLSPVMDKPIYASHSTARMLWETFTIIITWETILHQGGDSQAQKMFHTILRNIHEAKLLQHDWETLINHTIKSISLIATRRILPFHAFIFYQKLCCAT